MGQILQVWLVAAALSCPSVATAIDVRPNVVLMMADDMGLGDTSAYQDFTGNSDQDQIYTPNMERLARLGFDSRTPIPRRLAVHRRGTPC